MEYLKEKYPDNLYFFKGVFLSAYDKIPGDGDQESSTVKAQWHGDIEVVNIAEKNLF